MPTSYTSECYFAGPDPGAMTPALRPSNPMSARDRRPFAVPPALAAALARPAHAQPLPADFDALRQCLLAR